MQKPHRMQLKGPWQFSWLGESGTSRPDLPISGQVKIPHGWHSMFVGHSGHVQLTRRFGKPTNLDDQESVYLVFYQPVDLQQLQLNQQVLSLPADNPLSQEFEITHLLQMNNSIQADFDVKQQPQALFEAVWLEIRSR